MTTLSLVWGGGRTKTASAAGLLGCFPEIDSADHVQYHGQTLLGINSLSFYNRSTFFQK
jgi:hypothetical protein